MWNIKKVYGKCDVAVDVDFYISSRAFLPKFSI